MKNIVKADGALAATTRSLAHLHAGSTDSTPDVLSILEYEVAAAAGKPMEGQMAIFPDMVLNLSRQACAMIERL
jgi:hypothetical protein